MSHINRLQSVAAMLLAFAVARAAVRPIAWQSRTSWK
jgi:hypothetical protein